MLETSEYQCIITFSKLRLMMMNYVLFNRLQKREVLSQFNYMLLPQNLDDSVYLKAGATYVVPFHFDPVLEVVFFLMLYYVKKNCSYNWSKKRSKS